MRLSLSLIAALLVVGATGLALAQGVRPGRSFKDCADVCPEMVELPPGEFTMGSPASEPGRDSDEVEHTVKIDYSFAVGKFLVTRKEFAQFVAATRYDAVNDGCYTLSGDGTRFQKTARYSWQSPGFQQTDNDPVVCVSWDDAHAYVNWLTQKTKKQYRLLSESEWEYAARAGTKWAHYWGADDDGVCKFANVADQRVRSIFPSWRIPNCTDNYLYTSPVGSFPANGFGLYDMSGNVWQWVEDCYHDNYTDAPVDGSPRLDEICSTRLLRGSPWYLNQWSGRSAYRGWGTAIMRDYGMGFRVARMMNGDVPAAAPAAAAAAPAARPLGGPPPRSIGR